MLLCSENTASTADSTQNKMILYRLFENLCLQQRRQEERGCLQEEHVGGLLAPGLEQQGGHCLVALHLPLDSKQPRGDGTCVLQILATQSDAHQGAKQTPAAKGILPPSSYARETACRSSGSWQLSGMPATGFCFAFLKAKLRQK